MLGNDTKRHPAPRPPSPPRPSPPRPSPPRPFPHPPGGPVSGGAAAAAGLRRLGGRGGLLGAAALAGLVAWWWWERRPKDPDIPWPAPQGGGVWQVFGTFQQCAIWGPGFCLQEGPGTVEVKLVDNLGTTTGRTNIPYLKGKINDNYWIVGRKNFHAWDGPDGSDGEDIYLTGGSGAAPAGLRMIGIRVVFVPGNGGGPRDYPDLGGDQPNPDRFKPTPAPAEPAPHPAPSPAPAPAAPPPNRRPKAPPHRPAPLPPAPRTPEPAPAPAPRPPAPDPAPRPAPDPAPRPAPAPAPRPWPVPRPPAPAPAPAPLQWPAEWPQQAPRPAPLKPRPLPMPGPGPVITTDGAARPELEPVTDPIKPTPDIHVVEGIEFGGGGQDPPPTLRGIAAELGRLESKAAWLVERLLRSGGGGGGCQFVDRTDEVLEVIESLQFDVDELSARGEPKIGPLVYTVEAPADYDELGEREKFEFDIPRLPASEFISLYLKRQAEYQHQLKVWRNHVARKETNPKPIRIEWEEVPVAGGE